MKKYSKEYVQRNWAKIIISNSMLTDRNRHRPFDCMNYIDAKWVEERVNMNPCCHYCTKRLKYGIGVNRSADPDALQMDRMDNSLAHFKSNCVQCCSNCNHRGCMMTYEQKKLLLKKTRMPTCPDTDTSTAKKRAKKCPGIESYFIKSTFVQ